MSFIISNKKGFEIPPKINQNPLFTISKDEDFKRTEQETYKTTFEQKNDEISKNSLVNMREGLTKTMVCRVAELVNKYGMVKGFMLKSVIGEVGKKKEHKEKQEENLDSYVEEEELI